MIGSDRCSALPDLPRTSIVLWAIWLAEASFLWADQSLRVNHPCSFPSGNKRLGREIGWVWSTHWSFLRLRIKRFLIYIIDGDILFFLNFVFLINDAYGILSHKISISRRPEICRSTLTEPLKTWASTNWFGSTQTENSVLGQWCPYRSSWWSS